MGLTDSLYEHLKAKKDKSDAKSVRGEPKQPSAPALPGFERTGEFSWKRVSREPNPLIILGADAALLSTGARPSELLFFDTETTGLSGGAGNLAFLLGAGYVDGNELVVEQHFLADFPGEPEFLALIKPLFADGRIFVSYNGSAFDAHLLRSRYRMNRLEIEFQRQYDLLHPTRRLWKASVGACSLKNIERQVLGVERGEDIDGAEVPEYYFRFLRTGDPSSLEPVFFHNRIDVVSLARLLAKIESLVREPESLLTPGTESAPAASTPPDLAALGRMLSALDPDRAERFFHDAFTAGDAACGRALGYAYKRRREYEQAFAVWEKLFATAAETEAGIELAMHLEHRARNTERALAVVRALLDAPQKPAGAYLRGLEARRDRLERKLSRG